MTLVKTSTDCLVGSGSNGGTLEHTDRTCNNTVVKTLGMT